MKEEIMDQQAIALKLTFFQASLLLKLSTVITAETAEK